MRIVNLLSIACVLVSLASCNDATDSLLDKQTNAELETFMSGTDFDMSI